MKLIVSPVSRAIRAVSRSLSKLAWGTLAWQDSRHYEKTGEHHSTPELLLKLHRYGHAESFKDGDRVEIRFEAEDSFTPYEWEPGKIIGLPIDERDTKTYVNVMLDDGMYVALVDTDRVRL